MSFAGTRGLDEVYAGRRKGSKRPPASWQTDSSGVCAETKVLAFGGIPTRVEGYSEEAVLRNEPCANHSGYQ